MHTTSSSPNLLLLKHPQSLNHLVLTLREQEYLKKTHPCENTAAACILTEIVELIGEEKQQQQKRIKASIDSIVIKVSILTFFKKKKRHFAVIPTLFL